MYDGKQKELTFYYEFKNNACEARPQTSNETRGEKMMSQGKKMKRTVSRQN